MVRRRLHHIINLANHNRLLSRLILLLAIFIQPFAEAGSQNLTMTMTAEVMGPACSLRSGEENLYVNFGDIINNDLLRDGRTQGTSLQIHLDECDPTIADSIKVTFLGAGTGDQNGLLALGSSSQAKGIAIGFEQRGQFLPINQASSLIRLVSGTNVLDFTVYVQLLSWGNKDVDLKPGTFNATANFMIEYE